MGQFLSSSISLNYFGDNFLNGYYIDFVSQGVPESKESWSTKVIVNPLVDTKE